MIIAGTWVIFGKIPAMKNTLLALALAVALSSGQLHAQATINASNLFDAGDRFINGVGAFTLDPNVVPGNSGPAQVWNFTTTSFDFFDTTDIYAPGWVSPAYTSACPQTTHLMAYGTGATNFDLILVDGTGFYIVGNSFYSPVFGVQTTVYQNYVDWMRFPAAYGQSYIDTVYGDNTLATSNGSIDSTRTIMTITFSSDINAWGTVIINSGSFDALRLARSLDYYITTFEHDSLLGWQSPSTMTLSMTMYEWWTDSAGIGYPIASIYVDQSSAVTQYNIMQLSTTEIAEQELSNELFTIYPSPSSGSINVATESGNGSWQISDITGRIILSGKITATLTQIEVIGLQSGIYTMTVEDADGNSAASKFVKE